MEGEDKMKANAKAKVKNKLEHCEEHGRSKELFCFKCRKQELPMCVICLGKHENEAHGGQVVHITELIRDVLKKVGERMKEGGQHQPNIARYSEKAEELIKEKETIRIELDERLKSLMLFYTQQKAIMTDNNTAMLKSYERILKETHKTEYNINDNLQHPDKIAKRVEDMINMEDYWVALAEANRALVEDVVVDESLIKEELKDSEACLLRFKDQLATLDITPLYRSKHQALTHEQDSLLEKTKQQDMERKKMEEDYTQRISNFTSFNEFIESKEDELAQANTQLAQLVRTDIMSSPL
jgi:hypothetical protein